MPGVSSKWQPLEGDEHIVGLKYILRLSRPKAKYSENKSKHDSCWSLGLSKLIQIACGHCLAFMAAFRKCDPHRIDIGNPPPLK